MVVFIFSSWGKDYFSFGAGIRAIFYRIYYIFCFKMRKLELDKNLGFEIDKMNVYVILYLIIIYNIKELIYIN